ncbi:MAG TPA: zinc ABC transporter substrate-binding protein [Candidatus Competibacteraceae bacterium]|nr:zinc ABC transporter substrate-binding protein [Candidatus Competibacteraceae bacterium]
MRKTFFALLLALLLPLSAWAATPRVVASIKPVHSLVSAIMDGSGQHPLLLVRGGASPHDYNLRPSEVQAVNGAAVVFWIGDALESFLVRPLANARGVRSVELLEAPGVERLPLRQGGAWEAHEAADEHDQEHGHAGIDAHIWLDPDNARAMARHIAQILAELDPAQSELYRRNAAALDERLALLDRELAARLRPLRDRPYIVFHDAYQYFERHYGLAALGSITLSPEQRPGARRVQELRRRIEQQQALCVFSEPQFKPELVNTLIQGTTAGSGVLDPEGADIAEGPDAYFQLMRGLAEALAGCLLPRP